MAIERVFKIRASPTLRKEIIRIIKENNLSINLICQEVGYKYQDFIMWLNAKDGGRPTDNMSEFHIQNICQLLGIEIVIKFRIHKISEQSINKCSYKNIRDKTEMLKQRKEVERLKFFSDEEEN